MQPNTFILHIPTRLDRIPTVAGLLQSHPGSKIVGAVTCPWDPAGAVRGRAVSHLETYTAFIEHGPVLVLEDDAKPTPEHQAWCKDFGLDDAEAPFPLHRIPEDAGLILFGPVAGAREQPDANGFCKLTGPFSGTKAVLYLPELLKTGFAFQAFRMLAGLPVGVNTGQQPINLDTILESALKSSALAAYVVQTPLYS